MSPKDTTRLGKAIARYRKQAGLSQYALAKAIDVPPSTILRLEKGEFGRPDPEKLGRIAETLGVEAEQLYVLAPYPELPEMAPYLRAKYGMDDEAVAEAEAFFAELNAKSTKTRSRGGKRRG